MKKFLNIFMLFWMIILSKAQVNICAMTTPTTRGNLQHNPITEILPPEACNKTSQYYTNPNIYLPKSADSTITIRLNFIFPTKPDGTGNFEQNNPLHVQVIDDIILLVSKLVKTMHFSAFRFSF